MRADFAVVVVVVVVVSVSREVGAGKGLFSECRTIKLTGAKDYFSHSLPLSLFLSEPVHSGQYAGQSNASDVPLPQSHPPTRFFFFFSLSLLFLCQHCVRVAGCRS